MLGPLALLLALASAPDPTPAGGASEAGGSPATAEPAATPAEPVPPPPPPPPPPPSPPGGKGREEETWLDASHAFIEHRVFAPVLRVDRFFSDERDLEVERSRSFVRWRNELRFVEDGTTPRYTTSLSANLRLPGLNKQLRRLRIEIAGQTRDAFSAIFPGEEVAPGEVPAPEENVGTADAGLRFSLWDRVRTHGDVGAGLLMRLPPGAYTRVRLRFAQPVARRLLTREALSGFWRTDTGFGTTGSAGIERPLAPTALARLGGSTTISEKSRGLEWTGEISLLATFRGRLGAQVGASLAGATSAPTTVDRYRIFTRLRRDVYRRWIFLELEPEYAWPWTPELGRHRLWAVAFRLEIQFRGNEKPPPPKIPPQPEPPDPPPLDALPATPAAG